MASGVCCAMNAVGCESGACWLRVTEAEVEVVNGVLVSVGGARTSVFVFGGGDRMENWLWLRGEWGSSHGGRRRRARRDESGGDWKVGEEKPTREVDADAMDDDGNVMGC